MNPFVAGGERLARLGLRLVLGLAIIALIASALLDQSPTQPARLTLFPAGLTLLDPLAWDAFWNSAVVAGATAGLAFLLGVSLARLLARRRIPGQRWLFAGLTAVRFVPPYLLVWGALLWWQPALPALASDPQAPWFEPWNWTIAIGWWLWLAGGTLAGTAQVIAAVAPALAAVDPDQEAAARLLGASSRRAWRTVAWPRVRHTAVDAATRVFALALLDPGLPFLLQIRRSLGFQVVRSLHEALGGQALLARPALGVLVALALSQAVRAGLLRLCGPVVPAGPAAVPSAPSPRAGWRRGLAAWLVLPLAILALALPVLAALGPLAGQARPNGFPGLATAPRDPFLRAVASDTAWLALAAAALALLMARACAHGSTATDDQPPSWRWSSIPPLAWAVGLALVGPLCRLLAQSRPGSPLASGLASLADWLDPLNGRLGLMVVPLALVPVGDLLAAAGLAARATDGLARDAARLQGASPARAWWLTAGAPWLARLAVASLLALALCAADPAAPLVFGTTSETTPLARALLATPDPVGAFPTLAWLAGAATVALVIPAVLAPAWPTRTGPAHRPGRASRTPRPVPLAAAPPPVATPA